MIRSNQFFLLIYNIDGEVIQQWLPSTNTDNTSKNLLTERAKLVWDDRIQAQTIFDTERDHYQLVYVGWRGSKRLYGTVLHLDIIDRKIWIQQDGTEVGIANQLVELGVPKEDIVLGFDPPKMRHYTDFVVG